MAQQPRFSKRDQNQLPPPTSREVWIPAAHPQNHQQKWPSRDRLLLAAFFTLFSLASLVTVVSVTLLFFYSGLIIPGARVIDLPLGTLSTREAAVKLGDQLPQREVMLVHSTGAWPVTVADLGLSLDVDATVAEAYDLGRTLPGLMRVAAGNLQVEPQWAMDMAQATVTLDRIAPQIEKPPVNATIAVEDGQAREVAAQPGLALDRQMTLNYLQANPEEIVRAGRLPLATQPVAPQVTDVSPFKNEAQRLLTRSVTIAAYDPILDETAEWQIQPTEWQEWLSLVVTPGELQPFSWTVDDAKAQQFLAAGWSWLGGDRYLDSDEVVPAVVDAITSDDTSIQARVYHQPRQHVVRPGESFASIGYNYGIPYPWVQQANPGLESLAVGDVVTIPSADDMLPLPVVPGKRVVVSLGQQRAWVYENGQIKWDWPASTGISNSPTSPGIFQIQSHDPEAYASNWDLYMPTFMGIYRPVPAADFMNGFHGFPTRDGQNLLWTGDLGRPVTYGCILLSSENAQTLYDWAEDGVIVEVQP
jgi:lipoprotein-anchoring transpeptidase ErfK/SrfK